MRSGTSWLLLICILALMGGMITYVAPSPLKRDHLIPLHRSTPDQAYPIQQGRSSLLTTLEEVHSHTHTKHRHSPQVLTEEAIGHVLPRAGGSAGINSNVGQNSLGDIAPLTEGLDNFGLSRGGEVLRTTQLDPARAQDPAWRLAATQKCSIILKQLWAKQGGIQLPDIQLADIAAYGKPAEYDVSGKQILLDPRAYHLCISLPEFGEEALAFLIAHELIHSYQHNSLDYQSLGFFVKTKSLEGWAAEEQKRRKNMETQADIWGAVLCYMAGYRVDQSIPHFIEELYLTFGLDEEDPGYDSKQERLEIAERAQAEVRRSIQIFEMANYMSVLQQHDKDTSLYRYLIDQFRSAEFYNNLGISYLRLALPKLEEPYRSLPYPFLYDMETRLEQAISKNQNAPAFLIRQGILNFDKISGLNARYGAAHLNRAIAYHMLSGVESKRASSHLDQVNQNLTRIEHTSLKREVSQVRELMRSPEGSSADKRRYLAVGEPIDFSGRIDEIDLTDGYALDDLTYDWTNRISFADGISVSGIDLPQSRLLCFEDKGRFTHAYLQIISKRLSSLPSDFRGKVFQVGDRISEAQKVAMRSSLPTVQGNYFLVHDALGIVYTVGKNDRIQEWAIWREW